MRLQNAIAGLVFVILLASCVAMQLLQLFPASGTLWYLNITFAREARPVLELLDFLPFQGLAQNCLVFLGMIGLCILAVRRGSKIMTATNAHVALYAAVFAGIASHSRTFGDIRSASTNPADMVAMASALDPGQMALVIILATLLITCLASHYQIISDLIRQTMAARRQSCAL